MRPTDDEAIDLDLLSQFEAVDPQLLAQMRGTEEVDPTLLERSASRYGVDVGLTPEKIQQLPELTNASRALQGRVAAPPTPELGALGLGGAEQAVTRAGENTSQAALNLLTTDPVELADILTTRFPEDIEVSISPEGVPVASNKHTGEQFVINKPGFSPMDVLQGVGLIAAYSPAGKFASAPFAAVKDTLVGTARHKALTVASRGAAGRGMLAEGATEYGIQKAQEAGGGKMDVGEVAFSALTSLVPEYVMTPMGTLGRKVYDISKNKVVIPDGIQKAMEYARETGRKITTSDVLMTSIKAPLRVFLKGAERVPLIGTSDIKLRQAKERVDSLEAIFSHFDLRDQNYAAYIAGNFLQNSRKQAAGINALRTEAFDLMKGSGNVTPRSFLNTVDEELEKASKLEPDQRNKLMNYLNSVRQDFTTNPNLQFKFKDADLYLNSLMEGTSKGDAKGLMKKNLADALTKDMKKHALATDQTAFNKWDLARKLGEQELKKVEKTALAKAVKEGKAEPEIIDRLLDVGRPKDLKVLWDHTDATGRGLIRSRTLANVFRKAGGDLTKISETVDPVKLVGILKNDTAVRNQMDQFLSKEDRQLVDGWTNYLEQTNRSAKAFEGMGMLAAGGAHHKKGILKSLLGTLAALLPPTWAYVGAARGFESDAARDLFLKLGHAGTTELEARAIMSDLRPLILGLSQDVLQDGRDPFAPTVEPTMLEKLLGGSGLAGKQVFESVGEFAKPAWDSSMDYLRTVTGLGKSEEEAPQ